MYRKKSRFTPAAKYIVNPLIWLMKAGAFVTITIFVFVLLVAVGLGLTSGLVFVGNYCLHTALGIAMLSLKQTIAVAGLITVICIFFKR
jgi:hypothetical protein